MLGRADPDQRTTALFQESGGNPFYLEQLARSPELADRLSARPLVSVDGVHVPPLVVAALTEELALLSPAARRVLEGASVAGDPFEPEMAATAADVSEQEAMDAIDELLARDIIRPTDVPRRFRFRHPIVRRAVYESAPGGWRIGAHERAADALRARGAGPATRAHHVDISAKIGDAAAVATLAEAGRISAQRAPAIAVRWFSGALRLLPDSAPYGERVDLLLANATSLAATGRFSDAHAAILESLAIVPDEETALRLKLSATCARVEHLLGHHDQAHARLVTALDSLADAAGADAVGLMVELARDAVFRLQYAAGQEWAARAVAASRALADPLLVPVSLAIYARALAWGGDAERGEAIRSEAAALIDALSDDDLARRLDAWSISAERRSISTASGRPADTANARCKSDGQPARTSCSLESTRPSAWPGACSGGWPKPPSCSTPRSKPVACPGTRRRWPGRSSVAHSWRFPPGDTRGCDRDRRGKPESRHCGRSDRHRRPSSIGLAIARINAGELTPATEPLRGIGTVRSSSPRHLEGVLPGTHDSILACA